MAHHVRVHTQLISGSPGHRPPLGPDHHKADAHDPGLSPPPEDGPSAASSKCAKAALKMANSPTAPPPVVL